MRVSVDPEVANNGLFYIHSDHLGSTSVLTKYSDGYIVNSSLTRYTPFGGYRAGGPSQITDRAFTGQKENMALGLYYYNARYYLPGIGRFLSADTLVPNPQNPQQFNRYAYALNSPLNYSDPTGHRECGALDDCSDPLPRSTKLLIASSSRKLEICEQHALMQAVYSETQNGSYPAEHLGFLAWGYLNRISSGKWSNMGTAVYSDPPIGYIKGVPKFPGSPQSSAGVLWAEVRSTWTLEDVPELVEERWAYNGNPNWNVVENIVKSVYADWLENGAGSANDPTHGGYFYGSLTKYDENNGGTSFSEFEALLINKTENFKSYQKANPDFNWGHTSIHHLSGVYKAFFAANVHCAYFISCGE